ncbi:hypothetical protein EV363DRAFT_1557257 [Boletus edulis]|nr:hypothetical protein EV363DRAFT_1557257 [Boletus edulis]
MHANARTHADNESVCVCVLARMCMVSSSPPLCPPRIVCLRHTASIRHHSDACIGACLHELALALTTLVSLTSYSRGMEDLERVTLTNLNQASFRARGINLLLWFTKRTEVALYFQAHVVDDNTVSPPLLPLCHHDNDNNSNDAAVTAQWHHPDDDNDTVAPPVTAVLRPCATAPHINDNDTVALPWHHPDDDDADGASPPPPPPCHHVNDTVAPKRQRRHPLPPTSRQCDDHNAAPARATETMTKTMTPPYDDANYAGSPPPPPPRRRHSGTPVPLKQRRKRRRVITTTAADDADNARSPPLLCPHVNNDAAVSPPPTITATPPRRQRRRHHNHHAPMSVSTTATSPSPSPPALSHDDDAPSPSESESPSPLPSSRDEGTAVTAEDDAVIVGDISSQPPHCSTFDLHENSVATQIDLTAHLLAGLSLPSDAPLRTQELREALKESFTAVQSMINEYIQMAQWHHRHHVTTVPHVNDSDDAAVAPPPSPVCPHFQASREPGCLTRFDAGGDGLKRHGWSADLRGFAEALSPHRWKPSADVTPFSHST